MLRQRGGLVILQSVLMARGPRQSHAGKLEAAVQVLAADRYVYVLRRGMRSPEDRRSLGRAGRDAVLFGAEGIDEG